MDKKELEKKLQRCKQIKFRNHALKRMKKRNATKKMVIESLQKKKIYDHEIEKDTISKKHHIEYKLSNQRTITITARFKREIVYILTVIISSRKRVDKIRKRRAKWEKQRM